MTSVDKAFIQVQTHDLQTFPVGVQGPPGNDGYRFSTSFYGVKGWSSNLPYWTTIGAGGLGNITGGVVGTLIGTRIYVPFRCSLTQVQFFLSALQTVGVVGENAIGIYSAAGVKLAQTADLTTEFGSGSINEVRTVNLTSTIYIEAGYYWGIVQYRGATSPGMGMTIPVATIAAVANLNVTGLNGRAIIASMGASSLPTQLTNVSDVSRCVWLAVK